MRSLILFGFLTLNSLAAFADPDIILLPRCEVTAHQKVGLCEAPAAYGRCATIGQNMICTKYDLSCMDGTSIKGYCDTLGEYGQSCYCGNMQNASTLN